MSIAEELHKLQELRANGSLKEDEFERAKALALGLAEQSEPIVPHPVATAGALSWLKAYTRSNTDYMLGGVCGGLAERTPVPAWCWRVLFALGAVCYGFGLVLYLLLWVFAPAAPQSVRAVD
jgi:phage shock protein PspC (stress-responsive transcriptional regulator)